MITQNVPLNLDDGQVIVRFIEPLLKHP
jgi:hypothetical protein